MIPDFIRRRGKLAIWAAALAAFVLLIFAYNYITKKPPYEILETAKAAYSDLDNIVVETGIIKPQVGAMIKIGARATGEIMQMYIKVGDPVKKGQLIAKIDDRDIIKDIEELRIALSKAQSSLNKIAVTYPQKIREADQDAISRRAKLKVAGLEMQRKQTLLQQGYIAQNDFDKAAADFAQAEADARKNEETVSRLKNELISDRKMQQDDIASIKSNIEKNQIKLSYTNIVSPIDGVVAEIQGQAGETVVTGLQVANLVTVIVPDKLEMWIYVDESDIGSVKTGLDVLYTVDTYQDKIFKGIINRIDPQPFVKDNIVYYKAIVNISPDDAKAVRAEMTTHVSIITEKKSHCLTVPNAAVKFENGKYAVYKIAARGKVEKVTVKTGIKGQDRTEILSGLSEGDETAVKLIINTTNSQDKAGPTGGKHK
ncbi:MAG: efflux RND transporter periplasmic adaptor subunit [Candidatus Magnetominusculus sp. LBB02]|nr:efflux RND transporter periplasmic adaptor subunit [Candidatus Magnetominusculus sp. LBB02]